MVLPAENPMVPARVAVVTGRTENRLLAAANWPGSPAECRAMLSDSWPSTSLDVGDRCRGPRRPLPKGMADQVATHAHLHASPDHAPAVVAMASGMALTVSKRQAVATWMSKIARSRTCDLRGTRVCGGHSAPSPRVTPLTTPTHDVPIDTAPSSSACCVPAAPCTLVELAPPFL